MQKAILIFFKFSIFCQFFCGNQIELLFVAMIVVAVVVVLDVAVVVVLDVAAVVVLDVAAVIIVLMNVSSSFQGHL